MKKFSLILPLVAVASLASCGGTITSSGGGETASKVTFEFWHTLGQGLQEGLNDAIDSFEQLIKENEGVDVTVEASYQGSYDDIKNKIESGIGANNIPSLAVAYPDHVATYLDYDTAAGGKYIANLDDYMDNKTYGFGTQRYLGDYSTYAEDGKCTEDDIVPAFLSEGQRYAIDGTYSLPWMKSSEVMFYNFSAVKKCFSAKICGESFDSNVTTEDEIVDYVSHMSWDQMVALSKFALAHKDVVLPNMTAPIMYDSDSNLFITKMYQNNIPFASINESGKGQIDFESGENRAKAEAMATEYTQLVCDGVLTTKILQNGKYSSDYLAGEEVIFAIGSSGGAGYNMPTSSDQFVMKIAKVPASNNNPVYISQGPTLTMFNNADSKKTEYAWKFMKYLTNTEVDQELCVANSQGYIPVRTSCYDTEYFAEFLSDDTIYSQTAKVLLNDVNGSYIESDTFDGSADLRDQVGNIVAAASGLVSDSMTVAEAVSKVMGDAINEAKKKF